MSAQVYTFRLPARYRAIVCYTFVSENVHHIGVVTSPFFFISTQYRYTRFSLYSDLVVAFFFFFFFFVFYMMSLQQFLASSSLVSSLYQWPTRKRERKTKADFHGSSSFTIYDSSFFFFTFCLKSLTLVNCLFFLFSSSKNGCGCCSTFNRSSLKTRSARNLSTQSAYFVHFSSFFYFVVLLKGNE